MIWYNVWYDMFIYWFSDVAELILIQRAGHIRLSWRSEESILQHIAKTCIVPGVSFWRPPDGQQRLRRLRAGRHLLTLIRYHACGHRAQRVLVTPAAAALCRLVMVAEKVWPWATQQCRKHNSELCETLPTSRASTARSFKTFQVLSRAAYTGPVAPGPRNS